MSERSILSSGREVQEERTSGNAFFDWIEESAEDLSDAVKGAADDLLNQPQVKAILDGFSIFGGEPEKQATPKQTKDVQPKLAKAAADTQCTVGWATVYGPTGNPMSDGSPYTGKEQGVAIDLKTPVLGSRLGDELVITNLENGRTSNQVAKDRGGFGNPRRYGTPNGRPRLVDLTYASARSIGAGDMTPVRVCKPQTLEARAQDNTSGNRHI